MKQFITTLLLLSSLMATEPSWIKDPSQNGKYIGSIGCAKKSQSLATQEKIALLRAKGAISQQIDTDINDNLHIDSILIDDTLEESYDSFSTQESTTSFETEYKDRYIYSDKFMCVWIIKK